MFSRALDLEWEILQRVELRFATELEKQVDSYLANKEPPISRERPASQEPLISQHP